MASPPTQFKVMALPTEGRPADFSGAIGVFKITDELSASKGMAGDPLTLKMHVSGTGNFDRVSSSMLENVDGWKTYPPKSSFSAGDSVGYKGDKTFEQPVIPMQPGAQAFAPLSFSFFNPNTRKYETVHSAPLTVDIAGAAAPAAVATATTGPDGKAGTRHRNAGPHGPARRSWRRLRDCQHARAVVFEARLPGHVGAAAGGFSSAVGLRCCSLPAPNNDARAPP